MLVSALLVWYMGHIFPPFYKLISLYFAVITNRPTQCFCRQWELCPEFIPGTICYSMFFIAQCVLHEDSSDTHPMTHRQIFLTPSSFSNSSAFSHPSLFLSVWKFTMSVCCASCNTTPGHSYFIYFAFTPSSQKTGFPTWEVERRRKPENVCLRNCVIIYTSVSTPP